MQLLTVAGVLLLAALGCTEETPPRDPHESPARELYPLSSQGRLARGERDAPAVRVRLQPGGQLQVEDGVRWTDATLDDLGARLAAARRRELDDTGFGGISKQFLSIEADPHTPWQHLAWLMTVAAEQKLYKVELSDGARRLLAFLPCDRDPPLPPHGRVKIVLQVHVVGRAEKEAAWGGVSVMRPTAFLFRFREREADGREIEEVPVDDDGQSSVEVGVPARTGPEQAADLASVPRWIDDVQGASKEAGDPLVTGEIRAGNKVPFARILDVMECFLDHGLPAVDFHVTGMPSVAVRTSGRLPYPARNYDKRD